MGKSHGQPHASHAPTGHAAHGTGVKCTIHSTYEHDGQGSKTEELIDEFSHMDVFTQMGSVLGEFFSAKKI
jgi:hypothetical protein